MDSPKSTKIAVALFDGAEELDFAEDQRAALVCHRQQLDARRTLTGSFVESFVVALALRQHELEPALGLVVEGRVVLRRVVGERRDRL